MKRTDAADWIAAEMAEIDALRKSQTFVEVAWPEDCKIIGSKWVYETKEGANGETSIYKARVVAKGYAEVPGIDYDDTYAPAMQKSTLLTLLAFAAANDYEIYTTSAFLNGVLKEEVYLEPPEGFHPANLGHIWALHKSLYGLKDAPAIWYDALAEHLETLGYTRSVSDACLFFKDHKGRYFVGVYVDNMLVVGKGETVLWLEKRAERKV
jgi:hypothetical protein